MFYKYQHTSKIVEEKSLIKRHKNPLQKGVGLVDRIQQNCEKLRIQRLKVINYQDWIMKVNGFPSIQSHRLFTQVSSHGLNQVQALRERNLGCRALEKIWAPPWLLKHLDIPGITGIIWVDKNWMKWYIPSNWIPPPASLTVHPLKKKHYVFFVAHLFPNGCFFSSLFRRRFPTLIRGTIPTIRPGGCTPKCSQSGTGIFTYILP